MYAICIHLCRLALLLQTHVWILLLLGSNVCQTFCIKDKFLWYLNPLIPESLPKPLMEQGRKFDHHLIVEMTECPRAGLETLLRHY